MAYRLFFDQVEDPSTQFLDFCPKSAFFGGVRYPIEKAINAKILKSLLLELGTTSRARKLIFKREQ